MKEMQEQRELEALVAASGVQLVNVPKKQPSITEEGPPLSLDADSDDKQGKKDGTNKEVAEEDDGDVLGGAPPGVIKDRSPGRRGRFAVGCGECSRAPRRSRGPRAGIAGRS